MQVCPVLRDRYILGAWIQKRRRGGHQMEIFSAFLALCTGNLHKGQWRGALMFFFICARINGWVNNREAGDLRRYRAQYDAIAMYDEHCCSGSLIAWTLKENVKKVHQMLLENLKVGIDSIAHITVTS